MCIGLMISGSEFRCGDPGSISGRGVYELTFQYLEGSNEEIMATESWSPGFSTFPLSHLIQAASGLEEQRSWMDSWLSLHACSAAWCVQACEDMADFRPNQKQMSWLRKSRYFRWQPSMKISIVKMAKTLRGLELPIPTLCNIFPLLAIHPLYICHTTGPHV